MFKVLIISLLFAALIFGTIVFIPTGITVVKESWTPILHPDPEKVRAEIIRNAASETAKRASRAYDASTYKGDVDNRQNAEKDAERAQSAATWKDNLLGNNHSTTPNPAPQGSQPPAPATRQQTSQKTNFELNSPEISQAVGLTIRGGDRVIIDLDPSGGICEQFRSEKPVCANGPLGRQKAPADYNAAEWQQYPQLASYPFRNTRILGVALNHNGAAVPVDAIHWVWDVPQGTPEIQLTLGLNTQHGDDIAVTANVTGTATVTTSR